MWLLVLLVAVSVVVTVVARRRHTDERDSVDAQQRRLDALRTAVGQHDDPNDLGSSGGGGVGLATMRRSRADRTSTRSVLGTALIAAAVVIAGVAIYALAAGWDTASRADDNTGSGSGNGSSSEGTAASSSTTTSSTSSTTTTTTPAVPTVLSAENGNVIVSVPSGPYQLHITATDPCWTQVERADGTEVETKTLQAGEAIDVNESGALTIRFGNPAAAQVTIDGTALTLPPSTGDSLRVALVPAT